jgi:chaperone required for assembly of F1-ATPase
VKRKEDELEIIAAIADGLVRFQNPWKSAALCVACTWKKKTALCVVCAWKKTQLSALHVLGKKTQLSALHVHGDS